MKTSYFANRKAASEPSAVSIARWPPRWWGSRRSYIALAPSAELLRRAKAGMPWPDYVGEYKRDVLDRIDPAGVYADLGPDAILMCWEASGENCHRRLVAAWIEQALDVIVPEY